MAWGVEPPAIRRQGVVNAASQRPAAVGGAIARGSLVTIHGVRFAAGPAANRVTLESGGQVRDLTILRGEGERMDAWIPPDAPLGEARITVTANGLASAPEELEIRKAAPGLFSANGDGWGPARASQGGALEGAAGGRITLAATGLAAHDKPEFRVGNAAARVIAIRTAAAPDYTAQVTLETPAGILGCFVPVYARVGGAPPSNVVTVSIHAAGKPCPAAAGDPLAGWNGGRTGLLLLSRTVRQTLDAPEAHTEDEMAAAFFDVPAGKARSSPLLALPPEGMTTAWSGALESGSPVGASIWTLLFGGMTGQGLDAGSAIALRGQSVQLRAPMERGALGLYRRALSGAVGPLAPRYRLSLDAPRLGMAGSGGPQVGPFAVGMPAPAPFPAALPAVAVERLRPMTVEWGAANGGGTMAIFLLAADANRNVAALAYGVAAKSAGRFTLPPDLLAQLPAGRGSLVMASWQVQTPAPPSGIARLIALSVFARSWEVEIE